MNDMESMTAILGQEGPIARHLDNFAPRIEQQHLGHRQDFRLPRTSLALWKKSHHFHGHQALAGSTFPERSTPGQACAGIRIVIQSSQRAFQLSVSPEIGACNGTPGVE